MSKTKKRKIAVVTGTRAEYGIFYPVLKAIKKQSGLELLLVVAGMHFSHESGYTIKEIEKDGFKIDAKIDMSLSDDSGAKMARSIGVGILEFVQAFEILKPDMILILGDREEPFAAAIAGVCMNIPVAHIAGGEVGFGGHIDESIRHSLTKFSHLHFPATKKGRERILKLGEEPWRIFKVGSPAIDNIFHEKLIPAKILAKKLSFNPSKPIILVIQHPLAIQPESSAQQMRETMEAIKELGQQTIVVYPNTDAGGKRIIEIIKEYKNYSFIKIFKNIPRKEYLSLLKLSDVMVGNSSSGIIEAASFSLPVVNIGLRQEGRERANNVIDVDYDKKQIIKAIRKSLDDKNFKKKIEKSKSPYGDGESSIRIAKILNIIKIDKKLLQKRLTY